MNYNNPISLYIVDDESTMIQGLSLYFSYIEDFEILGSANSGYACIQNLNHELPDILLMDIKMESPKAGIQAAMQLLEKFDHLVKIIFLTAEYELRDMVTALKMRCSFIDKSCPPAKLVDIIREVWHQDRLVIDVPQA